MSVKIEIFSFLETSKNTTKYKTIKISRLDLLLYF